MAHETPPGPLTLARGTFLIASPGLLDPNFRRTVVLLCAHGPEGSYGLVLNRARDLTVADLSSDSVLLAGRTDPLWSGGPVQQDTLQVLHRLGPGVPGALHIVGDVHLGGDPVVLRARLDEQEGEGTVLRFVLGYSGWGKDQLEAELEEGAWILAPANEALVFDAPPGSVWRRALRALGPEFAEQADEPLDPSWN